MSDEGLPEKGNMDSYYINIIPVFRCRVVTLLSNSLLIEVESLFKLCVWL